MGGGNSKSDDKPIVTSTQRTTTKLYSSTKLYHSTELYKSTELDSSTKSHNNTEFYSSTEPYNNTERDKTTEEIPTTEESGSQTLPVVMTIICLFILVIVVGVVVVMLRRNKCVQMKRFHTFATKQIDNGGQSELGIYANEIQATSLHKNNVATPLNRPQADGAEYSPTDDDPTVYSEVDKKKVHWKKGQGSHLATDETRAAAVAHTAGPDIYTAVNKPSKALKTDQMEVKGLVNKGKCSQGQIYSLATDDSEDIYANEPALQSTGLMTETTSKTSMPQVDVGQTVIENDLYCH